MKTELLKGSPEFVRAEVLRRSTLPPQEIEEHAKRFPFINREVIGWNANSGHAHLLCRYAGYGDDYVVPALIQHGITFVNDEWEWETRTNVPMMLVWGKHREDFCKQRYPEREVRAIGAPFAYAPDDFFSQDYIDAERKRLGRNLLVFPSKVFGNKDVGMSFDQDQWWNHLGLTILFHKSCRLCTLKGKP